MAVRIRVDLYLSVSWFKHFLVLEPTLIWPPGARGRPGLEDIIEAQGPTSPLADFLQEFGPALLKKYNPRGIVVFSAHWESEGERLGSFTNLPMTTSCADYE
jgi:hypothetical protein